MLEIPFLTADFMKHIEDTIFKSTSHFPNKNIPSKTNKKLTVVQKLVANKTDLKINSNSENLNLLKLPRTEIFEHTSQADLNFSNLPNDKEVFLYSINANVEEIDKNKFQLQANPASEYVTIQVFDKITLDEIDFFIYKNPLAKKNESDNSACQISIGDDLISSHASNLDIFARMGLKVKCQGENLKIVSFRMQCQGENCNYSEVTNSAFFTSTMKHFLLKLKPGTSLVFDQIKYESQNGTILDGKDIFIKIASI